MMLAIWRVTSGNGTPGLGADTFLVAQWSVVSVEGRDVSREGNVVRSNQSGVPSPSSQLDCSQCLPLPDSLFFIFIITYIINYIISWI